MNVTPAEQEIIHTLNCLCTFERQLLCSTVFQNVGMRVFDDPRHEYNIHNTAYVNDGPLKPGRTMAPWLMYRTSKEVRGGTIPCKERLCQRSWTPSVARVRG